MDMHLNRRTSARRWWIVSFLALLALFITGVAVSSHTLTGGELALFKAINNWPDNLRLLFFAITQLGSAWMLYIITLFLVWKRHYRLAVRIFTAGALASITCEIIKQLIGRPRPEEILVNINLRDSVVIGKGFPSGHTAIATVLVLMLWPVIPAKWRWGLPLIVVTVGLSRMYLGVHAPLDIVGGIAVGVVVTSLSRIVTGKLRLVTKITGMKLR